MTKKKLSSLCLLAFALGLFITQPSAWACSYWNEPWACLTDSSSGDETGGGTTSGTTGSTTGGASGSVPVPGTFALLAGGLAGLAWLRSKRSQD